MPGRPACNILTRYICIDEHMLGRVDKPDVEAPKMNVAPEPSREIVAQFLDIHHPRDRVMVYCPSHA